VSAPWPAAPRVLEQACPCSSVLVQEKGRLNQLSWIDDDEDTVSGEAVKRTALGESVRIFMSGAGEAFVKTKENYYKRWER
jgi:hypothetical protein